MARIENMSEIQYKFSLYPSRFAGYQFKKQQNGRITIYLSTLWNKIIKTERSFDENVNKLMWDMIGTLILERICLERSFQKIRMKNRCNPCKMYPFALKMFELM